MKGKEGQIGFTQVLIGALVLFIVIVAGVATFNSVSGNISFGESLANSYESVGNGFMAVLGPLFNIILGFEGDVNTNFLKVLSFILISIIVVGTLDSVNIFSEDRSGNLINLAIGIIVSIIGVRFMPSDIWLSLTAPASALVATTLLGAPFLAFFFITMKIRFPLANKLLWLFYVIFMSYLIFFPGTRTSATTEFAWVYVLFLVLGTIMLFFDSTVRQFVNSEKNKYNISKGLAPTRIRERAKITRQIKENMKLMKHMSKDDQKEIKERNAVLRKEYATFEVGLG